MSASIQISPSILSADMANLAHDLKRISNADLIHVDVMDGHFVPNLSYGTAIVKACKSATDIPLDVHLMVSNPDDTVDWYIDAGADLVTVHYEASTHLHRTVSHIKSRGGVGAANAEELGAAGATVLVAGSAVFGAEDPAQAVEDIRQAAVRGRASKEA